MSEQNSSFSKESLPEFFRGRIQAALCETDKEVEPHTEYYLVQVLVRFADINQNEGNSGLQEPLAFKLKRGLELRGERAWLALRELGEVSLLLSGVFSEFLNRRLVDVEYCMGMGTGAYQRLASMSSRNSAQGKNRIAFEELSERFSEIVEVLWAFQESTRTRSERDLLRLYETWLRTRNPRMQRELIRSGLLPTRGASLTVH